MYFLWKCAVFEFEVGKSALEVKPHIPELPRLPLGDAVKCSKDIFTITLIINVYGYKGLNYDCILQEFLEQNPF